MTFQSPATDYKLQPSTLTQPFWDAAREGRLIFQRCGSCQKPFFQPEVACPHCFSTEWAWEQSSGEATLYSYSVVHRAPTKAFTAPFVFAAIELAEGWNMFTNIVGVEHDALAIGMKLEVCFAEAAQGLSVPYFKPAAGASADA